MELIFERGVSIQAALTPDITPAEAREQEPQLAAACRVSAQETEKARKASAAAKATVDEDTTMEAHLLAGEADFTQKLNALTVDLREEHHALRVRFAIEEQVARLRNLAGIVNYYSTELAHYRFIRKPAHMVELRDAEANEAAAEFAELSTLAELAYVRMVISLEAAYTEAGGPLGAISPRVQELRAAATAAGKRWESAQAAARAAREHCDAQVAAYITHGPVGSAQVSGAVPKF